jgi:uncharacterized protein (DUF305 family)
VTRSRLSIFFLVLAALPACRTAARQAIPAPAPPQAPPAAPSIVRPGAPGEPSTITTDRSTPVPIGHVKADVAFMQGMIGHHAQALEMVALLQTRTANPDMKLLAMRIQVSQQDEIRFMQRWLESRGEAVPGPHAHHAHDFKMMPGMLTSEEMAALAAARGPDFDRLFLRSMIKHHEGAIVMVNELFKQDGAGQEAEVHAFASEVVADQQMEIGRMLGMLRGLQK